MTRSYSPLSAGQSEEAAGVDGLAGVLGGVIDDRGQANGPGDGRIPGVVDDVVECFRREGAQVGDGERVGVVEVGEEEAEVAALREEGYAVISSTGAVLSVAVPVAVFVIILYALVVAVNLRALGRIYQLMLGLTIAALAGSVLLSLAGVPFAACLAVIVLAPWINVAGVETVGHHDMKERLSA